MSKVSMLRLNAKQNIGPQQPRHYKHQRLGMDLNTGYLPSGHLQSIGRIDLCPHKLAVRVSIAYVVVKLEAVFICSVSESSSFLTLASGELSDQCSCSSDSQA